MISMRELGDLGHAALNRIRRLSGREGLIILSLAACMAAVVGVAVLSRTTIGIPGREQTTFFRIATGSTGGTYFPVGKMLASVISKPFEAEPCALGGRCGVPGLIAITKTSAGSIANVRAVNAGRVESALAQADITGWAFNSDVVFSGDPPLDSLRVIANLYPEVMQLVTRRGSGIESIYDLPGRRVSLDREGSGTRADALLILKAFGIRPQEMRVIRADVSLAADMLLADELDAFFLISGTPVPSIADLARRGKIDMVDINGPPVEALLEDHRFLQPVRIPAGTYRYIGAVDTLSIGALWIVNESVDDDLVYEILQALFSPDNRAALTSGHAKGRQIRLDTAAVGVPILLHSGAQRFYLEKGTIE